MRHLKRTAKLGRTSEHRNRMLVNLVCSLIKHKRVTTTLAKAKAARSVAEKMVTLGKSGTLHDRRLVSSRLHQDEEAVSILFNEIASVMKDRCGGYTRIIKKMYCRQGDAASQAILEWVDLDAINSAVASVSAVRKTDTAGETTKADSKDSGEKQSGSGQ